MRGIVVGDILKMVARTLAKQISKQVDKAKYAPPNKGRMRVRRSYFAITHGSPS